VIEINLILVAQ